MSKKKVHKKSKYGTLEKLVLAKLVLEILKNLTDLLNNLNE